MEKVDQGFLVFFLSSPRAFMKCMLQIPVLIIAAALADCLPNRISDAVVFGEKNKTMGRCCIRRAFEKVQTSIIRGIVTGKMVKKFADYLGIGYFLRPFGFIGITVNPAIANRSGK